MNSNLNEEPREETQKFSGLQKIIGVFTSPGKTFASMAQDPSWLLPIIIFAAVNLIFLFTAQDIIIQETLTQQEEKMLEQGMDSEQIGQALATTEKFIKYASPIMAVVVPLIILLIVSAVFLFVGNVVMGGSVTFKQLFSVTAHSWLIFSLGALIVLPIVLAKDTMQVSFSLSTLMSEESEGTFIYQLLSKLDIFAIGWIAVQSIGLAAIYKMKTQEMATAIISLYAIYAIVASAIGSAFS